MPLTIHIQVRLDLSSIDERGLWSQTAHVQGHESLGK